MSPLNDSFFGERGEGGGGAQRSLAFIFRCTFLFRFRSTWVVAWLATLVHPLIVTRSMSASSANAGSSSDLFNLIMMSSAPP